MTDQYILDACALLALLRDETGADIVADIINQANNNDLVVSMHKANLLEVYYDIYRTAGKMKADEVITVIIKSQVQSQNILEISILSIPLARNLSKRVFCIHRKYVLATLLLPLSDSKTALARISETSTLRSTAILVHGSEINSINAVLV